MCGRRSDLFLVPIGKPSRQCADSAIPSPFNVRKIPSCRRLVRDSVRNVKFYQERFRRAGIDPAHVRTIKDLQRLPFLTKEELRSQFWDFLPHDLPACRVSRTSGSTGIPVCLFSDWRSRRANSGAVIRSRCAAGIPLWGRPILALLKTDSEPDRGTPLDDCAGCPQDVLLESLH